MYYSTILFEESASQQQKKQALNYYQQKADCQDRDALHKMGVCYLNGVGVSQSLVKSANYFEQSASLGHPLSQCYMGKLLLKGIFFK